ncbi:MAG: DUF362 domain-containing protein [Acidobacteriota bacterium]
MKAKVVIVRAKGIVDTGKIDKELAKKVIDKGLGALYDEKSSVEPLRKIFGRSKSIGIKINTLAGKMMSSIPEIPFALSDLIISSGKKAENIIVWDRTNGELKDSGYKLNYSGNEIRVFGTDTYGVGYEEELTEHRNIGSLFSRIQSQLTDSSISLGILKDHGITGITGGMKNYYGAVHNPNKYHDNHGNPFIADLFSCDLIKNKNKIIILDALKVQYHRGPSFHPKYFEMYESLIFGEDPVAVDSVGLKIIEEIRKKHGLKSLKEEDREPLWLKTASDYGLGESDLKKIEIQEINI